MHDQVLNLLCMLVSFPDPERVRGARSGSENETTCMQDKQDFTH